MFLSVFFDTVDPRPPKLQQVNSQQRVLSPNGSTCLRILIGLFICFFDTGAITHIRSILASSTNLDLTLKIMSVLRGNRLTRCCIRITKCYKYGNFHLGSQLLLMLADYFSSFLFLFGSHLNTVNAIGGPNIL